MCMFTEYEFSFSYIPWPSQILQSRSHLLTIHLVHHRSLCFPFQPVLSLPLLPLLLPLLLLLLLHFCIYPFNRFRYSSPESIKTYSFMSSPVHPTAHRRRSRSASSPFIQLLHRPSDDPNWRASNKRSRPNHCSTPSYKDVFPSHQPAEKWDVDQWRRGKRVRKDFRVSSARFPSISPEYSVLRRLSFQQECSSEYWSVASVPLSTQNAKSSATPSPLTNLPSSSKAFNLFPNSSHSRWRKSARSSIHPTPSRVEETQFIVNNVDQLRSNAFWELHRSVTENGEGLVQSMRDWEHSRSRSPLAQDRWLSDHYRRRQEPVSPPNGVEDRDLVYMEDDEDEEVEIVSGTISESRSPSHKKRSFSMGTMDIDLPDINVSPLETHAPSFASTEGSECCSSPIDALFASSAYFSDDEEMGASYSETRLGPLSTPSLSHTHPSSSNSSLVSLLLTHPSPSFDAQPHSPSLSPLRNHVRPFQVPATASRSEKAIAALTLAMANGAGGLNDYEALLQLEGASTQDESDIGEMWH